MSEVQRNEVWTFAAFCVAVFGTKGIRETVRRAMVLLVASCMAAMQVGCRTCDIAPKGSVTQKENGEVTGEIGIAIGGQESRQEQRRGGFWSEFGNTLRSPFYIHRCSDGKWFPEWREHPYRTAGMTALYLGAAAGLFSGGGEGSGSGKDGGDVSSGTDAGAGAGAGAGSSGTTTSTTETTTTTTSTSGTTSSTTTGTTTTTTGSTSSARGSGTGSSSSDTDPW